MIGTLITSVALPYQIYDLTHSTLMVGLLSLVQLLPLFITALLGGVIADHHNRRNLLLIAETLLAIFSLLLIINAQNSQPSIVVILIIAACMSAITGLHRPALESISQQIVLPVDFAALAALAAFKRSACMIIGPALGGIIISCFGIVFTYSLDCISFLVSVWMLLQMRHIPNPLSLPNEKILRALKESFHFALSRQALLGTYLIDFLAMVSAMPNALFPAIALNLGGASTLGLLFSAPAVGALLISLFSDWTNKVIYKGRAVALSAASWGIAISLFGLCHHFYLCLFYLALSGAFDALSGIFRGIIWNENIPNPLRGRLAGLEMVSYLSGPRLGDAKAGLLAALIGIPFTLISGGAFCVVSVGICCYFLPHFYHYQSKYKNSHDLERGSEN